MALAAVAGAQAASSAQHSNAFKYKAHWIIRHSVIFLRRLKTYKHTAEEAENRVYLNPFKKNIQKRPSGSQSGWLRLRDQTVGSTPKTLTVAEK